MLSTNDCLMLAALASFSLGAATSSTPTIDLGYGLWQGTLNATGQYYNFSNIRYAQAPVARLRFAPPQPPLVNRSLVNDGQDGRICPQGILSWVNERALFEKQFLTNPNNTSALTNYPPRASTSLLSRQQAMILTIYNNVNRSCPAPVMVWTYGGGFYSGSIESQRSAAGLLARSMVHPDTTPGMIYVSINYRLAALGWLSGTSFNSSGGTTNAGLYDQRLALEWVQEHISKFGGDPNRVTLAGESAGATMTLHQTIAFGNSTPAPFQQMFVSSPAFHPSANASIQEEIYNQFLQNANVTSLSRLRNASSEVVIRANELSMFQAPYGSSDFGPIIGDLFVPSPPDVLLSQRRHAKNAKQVMASHNSDEGLLFTDPSIIQNISAFNDYLQQTFIPAASQADFDYITTVLYPPINTNLTGLGYNDTFTRLSTMVADLYVTCNADVVLEAFHPNTSRAFLFAEGAGLHGEDTPYIFYNPPGPIVDSVGVGTVSQTSAQTM